jgi:GNAT superfamily N-acetyltransferase
MPDMLVKLYDLPPHIPLIAELAGAGVEIRPARAPEKRLVTAWIEQHFGAMWAAEAEKGFANTPVSTLLAIEGGALVGFACYDATIRGFFGPTGVDEAQRGRGIGKALLWAALHGMWEVGYAYAVIGGAGPVDFYAKAVGAVPIEGSSPGIYRGMLSEAGGV